MWKLSQIITSIKQMSKKIIRKCDDNVTEKKPYFKELIFIHMCTNVCFSSAYMCILFMNI